MTKEKILITLPPREEMFKRLIAVDNEPHFQKCFYPKLLKEAGQELYPEGVVLLLELAIYDYTSGMPPIMASLMSMKVPDFIGALIPDEVAAKEAKDFHAEANKG